MLILDHSIVKSGRVNVPEFTTSNLDSLPPVDSVRKVASSSDASVPKNAVWQYDILLI